MEPPQASPAPLTPPVRPPLTGDEQIAGTAASVTDFWRFAMSDLRMNNARGYLAEFLVALAVGATGTRIEWDAFDVLTPDGLRIEVKSAAYLQNWEQRALSRIQFSGLSRRSDTGAGTFHADIYVFAVQTATDPQTYDPLDVSQWQFHVLPRAVVEGLGQRTVGLATLHRLGGAPVPYGDLHDAIKSAADSRSSDHDPDTVVV